MGEVALNPVVDVAVDEPTSTTRRARIIAMSAFVLALAAYSKLVGLPADLLQVLAWMWLGTIAWNIQAPRGSHLVFVRDWWPALAVLEIYVYSRGVTSHLGLSVHITEPITADNWIGGGGLPTQQLQAALCGTPCTGSLPARWYDGLLTCVYYTHFIAAPIVAFVLYLRDRVDWIAFMRRYVALYITGLFFYITYPMAPPWMASDEGYISGEHVARITGRGWSVIGLEHFQQWLARLGNPVAAMPSLHAGTAALIVFYGVVRLKSRWRFLLLLYPVAMSFMLVYYGEHYVVDIIAGWLLAAVVLWGCANWEQGGALRRSLVAVNDTILGRRRDDVFETETPSRGAAWPYRLPPLALPCVVFALLIVGILGPVYSAIPALVLAGGLIGWLAHPYRFDRRDRRTWFPAAACAVIGVLVTAQVALLF